MLTVVVVMLKVAVVLLASTETLDGTRAVALLLDRFTVTPPLGAELVKMTVPVQPCPPVTVLGLTLTDCNAMELLTLNVAVSVSVPPVDSETNCVIVCVPLATDAVFQAFAAVAVPPAKSNGGG